MDSFSLVCSTAVACGVARAWCSNALWTRLNGTDSEGHPVLQEEARSAGKPRRRPLSERQGGHLVQSKSLRSEEDDLSQQVIEVQLGLSRRKTTFISGETKGSGWGGTLPLSSGSRRQGTAEAATRSKRIGDMTSTPLRLGYKPHV